MRKAAMMSKVVDGAFESPEDIEVRSLGGECHGRRGQRSLAIESSAGEDCASQEMSDRLQESFVTQHSHSGMASGWLAERSSTDQVAQPAKLCSAGRARAPVPTRSVVTVSDARAAP